ncbi:MAG: hypothetical protein B7X57_10485, partial [Erythrobacter sp. 34-65-8]
ASLSGRRSQSDRDDYALLVLTPELTGDAGDVDAILRDRTYQGPTLVILPKWVAFDLSRMPGSEAGEGWVALAGSQQPGWAEEMEPPRALSINSRGDMAFGQPAAGQNGSGWEGLGLSGYLPTSLVHYEDTALTPLVTGQSGETLAGFVQDDGYYPLLEAEAGITREIDDTLDQAKWPVVFVVEPDLANNYGFASRANAEAMHELVDLLSDDGDLPIIFDLTLNGLGASKNLLTLAFTPPFLAATLCLIIAMLVVVWRAFRRFGPPASEGRAMAFGKERLVRNSASFIQRSKRLHLLSGPYADLIEQRIGKALRLRHADSPSIGAALARRLPDAPDYAASIAALRNARSPRDILGAAATLRSIERMLSQ